MNLWDEYKAMLADTGDIFTDYIRNDAPPEVRELADLAGSGNGNTLLLLTETIEKATSKSKKLSDSEVAILAAGYLSLADLSCNGIENIAPQHLPLTTQLSRLFSADLIKHCARLLADGQDEQYRNIRKHLSETVKDIVALEAGAITQQKNARQGTTAAQQKDKAIVIQQWEKFARDKATAASFALKFCGDIGESAKPKQHHHDVITSEPLTEISKTYSNKTIRQWINAHRKGK